MRRGEEPRKRRGLSREGRDEGYGEGNTVVYDRRCAADNIATENHPLTHLRRLQIPGRYVLVLPLPLVSPLIKAPENNFPLPNPPDIAPLPHLSKLSRAREASALLDPPFAWTFDSPRISHHFGFIGHLWRQLGIGLAGMRLHGDVSDDEEEGAVMDPALLSSSSPPAGPAAAAASRLVVGYALTKKKVKSFLQPKLLLLAR